MKRKSKGKNKERAKEREYGKAGQNLISFAFRHGI
jgi:hypothetical protein